MTSTDEPPTDQSSGVTSLGPSTEVTADPAVLAAHEGSPEEETPATSNAEQFREDGETMGGTGGLDSGGAG
jgi:hypothetical protein